MEVIGGKRVCGKTTTLIKKAHEEQLYIICANKNMAQVTFKQAKDMGLDIPFPVSVEELRSNSLSSLRIDKVLIDEVELVLQMLIGVDVKAMSTSYKMNELESFRKEEKKSSEPLLVIELHDETAVPKVFYQGEEITGGKARISFDWETKTMELGSGGTNYNIEYAEVINKELVHKGIGLARGKYTY